MPGVWVASIVALWMLVLFMAFLLAGALRQIGLLRLRIGDDPGALITDEGLTRGAVAPDFEAFEASSGDRVQFSRLPPTRRVLVFLSASCTACRQLVPHLNEVAATWQDIDFVAVCTGDLTGCRQFFNASRLRARALIDTKVVASAAFHASVSPFVYVLDEERRVLARGVANDWRGLEALINEEGTLQAGRAWVADRSGHDVDTASPGSG